MKQVLLALLTLGMMAGAAAAATKATGTPPTAAQKAEFYKVCMGIAQDEALCSCKADAAMTLIDERMMGYVIAGMKGAGNAPDDVQHDWNNYVAHSNQICKPNY